MKKIFSKVAHVFKHEERPADLRQSSENIHHPEVDSLTSADSGVLTDPLNEERLQPPSPEPGSQHGSPDVLVKAPEITEQPPTSTAGAHQTDVFSDALDISSVPPLQATSDAPEDFADAAVEPDQRRLGRQTSECTSEGKSVDLDEIDHWLQDELDEEDVEETKDVGDEGICHAGREGDVSADNAAALRASGADKASATMECDGAVGKSDVNSVPVTNEAGEAVSVRKDDVRNVLFASKTEQVKGVKPISDVHMSDDFVRTELFANETVDETSSETRERVLSLEEAEEIVRRQSYAKVPGGSVDNLCPETPKENVSGSAAAAENAPGDTIEEDVVCAEEPNAELHADRRNDIATDSVREEAGVEPVVRNMSTEELITPSQSDVAASNELSQVCQDSRTPQEAAELGDRVQAQEVDPLPAKVTGGDCDKCNRKDVTEAAVHPIDKSEGEEHETSASRNDMIGGVDETESVSKKVTKAGGNTEGSVAESVQVEEKGKSKKKRKRSKKPSDPPTESGSTESKDSGEAVVDHCTEPDAFSGDVLIQEVESAERKRTEAIEEGISTGGPRQKAKGKRKKKISVPKANEKQDNTGSRRPSRQEMETTAAKQSRSGVTPVSATAEAAIEAEKSEDKCLKKDESLDSLASSCSVGQSSKQNKKKRKKKQSQGRSPVQKAASAEAEVDVTPATGPKSQSVAVAAVDDGPKTVDDVSTTEQPSRKKKRKKKGADKPTQKSQYERDSLDMGGVSNEAAFSEVPLVEDRNGSEDSQKAENVEQSGDISQDGTLGGRVDAPHSTMESVVVAANSPAESNDTVSNDISREDMEDQRDFVMENTNKSEGTPSEELPGVDDAVTEETGLASGQEAGIRESGPGEHCQEPGSVGAGTEAHRDAWDDIRQVDTAKEDEHQCSEFTNEVMKTAELGGNETCSSEVTAEVPEISDAVDSEVSTLSTDTAAAALPQSCTTTGDTNSPASTEEAPVGLKSTTSPDESTVPTEPSTTGHPPKEESETDAPTLEQSEHLQQEPIQEALSAALPPLPGGHRSLARKSSAGLQERRSLSRRCSHEPAGEAGAGSRRSSVEVLEERRKLRRTSSSQSEPTGDAVLDVMSNVHADSEARLAARRQARAEAREIRMKELERQQREAQLNGEKLDDDSDVAPPPSRAGLAGLSVPSPRSSRGPSSARRFSEDSTEDGLGTPGVLRDSRDLRLELRELEEKLRKTMVTSAQLDNEKSSLTFQLELFKDKLEEVQEAFTQLQRDHRVKCSEYEQLKRVSNRLKEDLDLCQRLLDERDQLIAENGLVLVGDELEDGEGSDAGSATQRQQQKALVTQSAARLLEKAGGGTLDDRLRRLGEERNELEDELRRVKLELEEERHSSARARIAGTGPESEDVQREVARQVGEYKFKQQKSDQEITNLQTSVQRLENQVVRYKSASEAAEKAEEELKAEKRKLQRELREALTRADELETANSHLLKRLDKLKNARSTLLKDLSAE